MKKLNNYNIYYYTDIYNKQFNIRMNWFKFYIRIRFPLAIFFNILSFISFLGISQWTDFAQIYLIIKIIHFVLLCYTYIKMKNLELEGYRANIAFLLIENISISLSAGVNLIFLFCIVFWALIWSIPNYIYFKKRKSIFGLNFETQIDNTNNNKHNEKIEQIWTSIKPEITDKIFQNNKEQASKIIISLSQMLNINLEKCDTKQYIYILSIYCDVFTWKIDKKASDKLIISSLQAHRKNYITSDYIAKNVLDFCVNNISNNGFTIPSSSNENLSNNSECKNNKYTFCNKCGNKLDDDYAFCNKCGHKVR